MFISINKFKQTNSIFASVQYLGNELLQTTNTTMDKYK